MHDISVRPLASALALGLACALLPLFAGAAEACTYDDIPGTADFVGVEKTVASSRQASTTGGPGYEGLEVSYTFTPKSPIDDPNVKTWAERAHTLQLANSWYPGPRFIEKYKIDQGASMPAVLKVITQGTCTPLIIEIPDVDRADYFETVK